MKAKEMLGLASRVIGLIVALYGVDWLFRFCLGQLGYFKFEKTDSVYYLITAIAYLSVGAYFLSGASHFVRYAYGDDNDDDEGLVEDISDAEQSDDTDITPKD